MDRLTLAPLRFRPIYQYRLWGGRRRRSVPAPAPPNVPDLVNAPELAAVILLEHALDVAASALVAEHLTLIDDFHKPHEQGPVLALAHTICLRAGALRDTLVRCRRAVRDAATPDASVLDDDLPF